MVAIVLFGTIGQISHDGLSVHGYATDVVPLLAGWLAAAKTGRFVPTWLLGVTAGVALRMVALGHYHWNQLSFLAVSLVFVGAAAFGVLFVLRRSVGVPV
jgi:hypothetical protein